MAPLVIEGDNLGEKHRQYNSLVKAATADQVLKLEKINYVDNDVDNLLKIDVACHRRDVEYILDVLTCDDMLYVTRAINKSVWLITEDQYYHIINPKHLHDNLFPKMTTRAKNKMLLAIRLNLKDVKRVEEFYHFYKDDGNFSLKWLPRCSPDLIKNVIRERTTSYHNIQDSGTLQRLCGISFDIFKFYCNLPSHTYYRSDLVKNCPHFLKNHTAEVLDIFDALEAYEKPKFGKKATQIIMKQCPDRISSNFSKYCAHLEVATFAKYLKKEQIQEFLLKQKSDDAVKHWFKFENIKHFIQFLPKENRFQFVKSLSAEKNTDNSEDGAIAYDGRLGGGMIQYSFGQERPISTNAHIYRWYRYAPFNTAFLDLKKLIQVESNPSERNAILTVLIHSARSNQQNIKTLLEFYREKHMNEPFKFKVQFVNTLLSRTKTHEYDSSTWSILNDIFSSMEVYMVSDNKVPFCIQAIIVYNLLHNQEIPKIIQEKHTGSTFKEYRKKLSESDQGILFSYLHNNLVNKLSGKNITNEADIAEALNIVLQLKDLLTDWNKNIADYPFIIDKIKELCTLKKQNSWNIDLTNLYTANKKWRKHLFEVSLILHPSDEACLNALKHDPGLLSRYESVIQTLFSNDSVSLKQVMRKLRIYWPQTIAQQWYKTLSDRMLEPKGQRSVLKSIFSILPLHQILPLLKEHAPVDTKINWVDANDTNINLRKYIGQNMHTIRSSINLDTVLLYAKGDYLLYGLPSLNSVLHNMSATNTSDCIMKLLNAPVSLQKHGIRTAFQKLNINEIKEIIHNIWNTTKNSSIKTVLFQETFNILCKEKNDSTVKAIWELMEMYIDSLSSDENRIIYNTFLKVDNVPKDIRPVFFMKGYKYLKSLPAKAKCDGILKRLDSSATSIIQQLEPSFVEDVLLESAVDKIVLKNFNADTHLTFYILTAYLLSCDKEEDQISKYEKLLVPILERSFAAWLQRHKGNYYVKISVGEFFNQLTRDVTMYTLTKNNIIPARLFKEIEKKMVSSLLLEENYSLIVSWRLATLFVEELSNYLRDNPLDDSDIKIIELGDNNENSKLWTKICCNVASSFGLAVLDCLKQEPYFIKYPCLTACITDIFNDVSSCYNFTDKERCLALKSMISDKNFSTIYCIALNMLSYMSYDQSKEDRAAKKEIYYIIRSNPSSDVKIILSSMERQRHRPNYDTDDEDKDGNA